MAKIKCLQNAEPAEDEAGISMAGMDMVAAAAVVVDMAVAVVSLAVAAAVDKMDKVTITTSPTLTVM